MGFLRIASIVFSILIYQAYAEKQLFCPNNGVPRSDIKCLPGQSENNNVCGPGYSCYFSGIDYHCCPIADESLSDAPQGECPDYTVALLDSVGKPVRCSTLGNECSGKNMYCNENSPVPICCQNLKPVEEIPKQQQQKSSDEAREQQKLQAVEEFFNSEDDQSKQENIDCPKHSLIVLNEDGEPSTCSSESDCPQSGMFCHGAEQKVCCESIEPAGTTRAPNSLNIRPDLTETSKPTSQETTIKSSSSATTAPETKSSLSTLLTTKSPSTQGTTKSAKIGLSEATYKNEKTSNKNPKVFASKTAKFDDDGKPIKYEPHVSGGYAVSQTFDKNASAKHADKKEIVQQYLLEQIKKGWPYNEQFFRPENTAVIQNNGRPTTVVHFP